MGATASLPIGGGRPIDLGSTAVPSATVGGIDESAVQLDAVMHGPQIGAVFRWGAGLRDA